MLTSKGALKGSSSDAPSSCARWSAGSEVEAGMAVMWVRGIVLLSERGRRMKAFGQDEVSWGPEDKGGCKEREGGGEGERERERERKCALCVCVC
jgi:hypothetical protein